MATRNSPSKGGTGDYDYAFTEENYFDYWKYFLISGDPVRFVESFIHYGYPNNSISGDVIDGYNWIDHNATITAVYENQPVPEPATLILFGTGLVSLLGLKRSRVFLNSCSVRNCECTLSNSICCKLLIHSHDIFLPTVSATFSSNHKKIKKILFKSIS